MGERLPRARSFAVPEKVRVQPSRPQHAGKAIIRPHCHGRLAGPPARTDTVAPIGRDDLCSETCERNTGHGHTRQRRPRHRRATRSTLTASRNLGKRNTETNETIRAMDAKFNDEFTAINQRFDITNARIDKSPNLATR